MKKVVQLLLLLFFSTRIFSQITVPDTIVFCPPNPVLLTANIIGSFGTASYAIDTIPFAPETHAGTLVSLTDDAVSTAFSIGFTFCFMGSSYTQFYVGSNGWISFCPGQPTTYTSAAVPNTGANVPKCCIMGPWQDWNPGIGGEIRYQVLGTAPNRRLVVSYFNVPMFSCTGNLGSFQIVCYETTNIIKNHIINKPNCTAWAGGTAVQGIHNPTGTIAQTVIGRNSTQWILNNESMQYTPNGLTWTQLGGGIVGSGDSIWVTPTGNTTYIATFTNCAGITYADTVQVITSGVPTPTTGQANIQCAGFNTGMAWTTPDTTGNIGPYVYNWYDANNTLLQSTTYANAVTDTIDSLSPGTYYLQIASASGCTGFDTITILQSFPILIQDSLISPATCNGFCDASSILSVSGNAGPFNISWANGGTGLQNDSLCGGPNMVYVTDNLGCFDSLNVIIPQTDTLFIDTYGDTLICQGDQVLLTGVVSGGTGTLVLDWQNGLSSNDSIFVTPTVTTDYVLMVTDSNGCFDTSIAHVEVVPAINLTMPNDTFVCLGDSILFSALVTPANVPSTYQWSNTNMLSSSNILNPMGTPLAAGVTTTFVVTVTTGAGCFRVDSFDITTSPLPLPTGRSDTTICAGSGQQVPMSVFGAGAQWNWSVISGTPMTPSTFSCNPCQFPVASPTVTTIYTVAADSFAQCGNIDTVKINVVSTFNINMPNDTILCYGDTINLLTSLSNYNGSSPATYSWSGTSISSTTTASPNVWPNLTQTYNLSVQSDSGCIKSDAITVTVSAPFPQNISATSNLAVVCVGELVNLDVDFGSTVPASCSTVPAVCPGTSQVTLGNGTQTNGITGYPNVYGGFYWGARHQILIRATELNAMGVFGGVLSSLALNVAQVSGSANYQNFSIKLGCTSQTSLNGAWLTGLQTVYTNANYNVVSGWNTHVFSNQYAWNGTSNLIVEICFNNTSFTLNSATFNNVTTFNSVQYYRADQLGVCNSGNPTVSTQRPNMRFNYCGAADPLAYTYQWSVVSGNGIISNPTNIQNPVAAVPNLSTFQVLVSDTLGACSATANVTVDVITSYAGSIDSIGPFCVTDNILHPLTGAWSTGIPAAWSGPGVTSPGVAPNYIGQFQPSLAGAGAQIVTLTVGPGSNCQVVVTDTIFVTPLPNVTIQDPGPICISKGLVQMVSADPNITGTGAWAGVGITPQGVFNPAIAGVGVHNVFYTQTIPCLAKDTFQVTVVPTFNSNFTRPLAICEYSNPVNLSADSAGGSFSGPGIVGSTFNPGLAGPGTHQITYSDNDTLCPSSTTKPIIVIETPDPDMNILLPFTGPWCEGFDTTFSNLPAPYPAGVGVSSQWGNSGGANLTDTTTFGNVFVNFNVKNLQPGAHTLLYFVTVTNQAVGCVGSDSIDIVVVAKPLAPTATSSSPYCEGEIMNDIFMSNTTPNVELAWYDDSTNTGLSQFSNNGTYHDTLVAWVNSGQSVNQFSYWATQRIQVANGWCESDATEVPITVYATPVASISSDVTDGRQPLDVQFFNASTPTDITTWNWTFGNGSASSDFEPTHTFVDYGSFVVQLIATNPIGCTDTARIVIIVDVDFDVVLPEVFSPNGDGINDIFELSVRGEQEFEAVIFDRWGKEVHRYTNLDDQWNGKRHNTGNDCESGVYFWTMKGVKIDGASTFSYSGTIQLLRDK